MLIGRKLKEIYIEGLFGKFNHTLDFKIVNRYKILLMYGPNDIGKTKILTIIHSLFKLDFKELFKTNFSKLN